MKEAGRNGERARILGVALAAVSAAACAKAAASDRAGVGAAATPASSGSSTLAAEVGQRIFFDESLSASGAMSCATCHDPKHAYGPPNDLAVQRGGPDGRAFGTRAVPSLRYKEYTPPYADVLDNPDGVSAPGPGGGFAWDGRADTLAAQARLPLLSPVEMANASPADVVAKLARAPYAALFRRAFGVEWSDVDGAFAAALRALEAFQREDASFHPYTSKFDLHADNKLGGAFTAAERRGFQLFVDPKRGNCASCHFHGAGTRGSTGMFTDYSYEAIGVPRNRAIPANVSATTFDLGLCGPLRVDHAPSSAARAPDAFCGQFKTPTLRNVASRKVFFHNGVVRSLEQAVRFYATRDTNPELWYPTVGGTPKARPDRGFPRYGLVTRQYVGGVVEKYDDLPAAFRANVDAQMPLDGRARGATPPLGERDVADLVCFLETLTDDYHPPATPPRAGRCVE